MTKYKDREKGDVYRPVVEVRKAKDGVPTSVRFGGHMYALVHDHYINGGKSKFKNK
ncbi:hypothetical protein [Bacillus sp. FJAT-45037]|uniref:hypothetical protein n=1 Tax=Bacillus sp. FJAT-45037 TaxID=2011007 RepID=UPI0012FD4441|nr:hypothetical protein [Bacillus sp. FJAT-45037]